MVAFLFLVLQIMPFKNPNTIMVQGTTSDAGKSVLVAGLGRVLARRGINVAPFKPQNMALNSAVTKDGGEIGRAQAVQAKACFLEPHTDMNPILLKPNSDTGAQVIVHGKVISDMEAVSFHDYKKVAMQAVLDSHQRLNDQYQVIVVEGAGSPAEINLRHNDIANMGFAEAVDCPVIIVADIDRGGVFAHLVGTLELLSESEQNRVVGFVINRFRGDIELLRSGLTWLEQRTGKPVLGVLPYLMGLHIEAEDAISVEQEINREQSVLKVVVPVLPRISNHTDFDALRLHPQVDLQYVAENDAMPAADLIILPGSKNVRADLAWLQANGWGAEIARHLRYGGKLLGICGGFQMLGESISDPNAIEGAAGTSAALGLLRFTTELQVNKQLKQVSGFLCRAQTPISGYEIHAGVSTGAAMQSPAIELTDSVDGAISIDDQIMGTYVHGLFDEALSCQAILQWAGLEKVELVDYQQRQDKDIERLADAIEKYIDLEAFLPLFTQTSI